MYLYRDNNELCYTHYCAKRNHFARNTSEIFGNFKKPLVEIFEIRNQVLMLQKLRNQPCVETSS